MPNLHARISDPGAIAIVRHNYQEPTRAETFGQRRHRNRETLDKRALPLHQPRLGVDRGKTRQLHRKPL